MLFCVGSLYLAGELKRHIMESGQYASPEGCCVKETDDNCMQKEET
jgi:hypothetical protein